MLKEEKMYVPKDEELRVEIIQSHHDILVAEHGRKWKTTELVARSDEKCWKIHGEMQYVSEDEK